MAADHFFTRWARPKSCSPESTQAALPAFEAAAPAIADKPALPPTLADVASLTTTSDYSRFLAAGVDKTVQRAALKKLFSDPRFNLIDGLDIYMGDYSKASPMPAAMLAALNHVQDLLAVPAAPEPSEPAQSSNMPLPAAPTAADSQRDAPP
jgi:hypothetical protein